MNSSDTVDQPAHIYENDEIAVAWGCGRVGSARRVPATSGRLDRAVRPLASVPVERPARTPVRRAGMRVAEVRAVAPAYDLRGRCPLLKIWEAS